MIRVGLLLATTLAALAAIWWLARDLAPPKSIDFAAGTEGGGYWQLAQRYKTILARDGITVRVIATAGSVENASLLASGQADVALLQGGILTEPGLEALGALFLEPVFLFAKATNPPPNNPGEWRSLRLAVGGEGSGTRAAFDRLAASARLRPEAITPLPLGGSDAVEALMGGTVDAAVFVAPVTAPYLASLFDAQDTTLLELEHITAISRLLPQSQVITLPSGALSLAPPVPENPIQLLAMVATLAAKPELHPSLIDRLVEAARQIHGDGNAIAPAGSFPNVDGLELPLNAQARDLITDGPSPFQAYLPYWVAAQIDRFAILFVPIVILLLPLLRLLPALYGYQMRHRVVRHYSAIRDIEEEARDASEDRLIRLRGKLAAIDADIAETRLPLHYRQVAYTARVHIDLLQNKISERLKG